MKSLSELAPHIHLSGPLGERMPSGGRARSHFVRAIQQHLLRGPKNTTLIDPYALPGMGTASTSTENTFLWGVIASWQTLGIVLKSTTVDAGSTPTTTLRKGLVLGAVGTFQLAPGTLCRDYEDGNTDGSQFAVGILYEDVNMLDSTNTAVSKYGRILWYGNVKAAKLYGLTGQARRMLANRIFFDDGLVDASAYQAIVQNVTQAFGATTGAMTVTYAMNNQTITTETGTGAVTFNLPAIASVWPGWRMRFINTVGQNMAISAPSNLMIQFNSATGTTLTFSTSGNLIGASAEIVVNAAGTKYIAIPSGANTATWT